MSEEPKVKRVRHSYPFREIYHRFVHSPEEVWHHEINNTLHVKGNYLFAFNINSCRYEGFENIEEHWFACYQSRCIAVIDRDKKKVVFNEHWQKHEYNLETAMPKDYSIYKIREDIPCPDILSEENEDLLLRITCESLFVKFLNKVSYRDFEKCLLKPNCYACGNPYKMYHEYYADSEYNRFVKLVKKHKLYNRPWFLEPVKKRPNVAGKKGEESIYLLPSLKTFYLKHLFTRKQMHLLYKKYYYRVTCHGIGIPYKTIEKNWEKEISDKDKRKIAEKLQLTDEELMQIGGTEWQSFVADARELIGKKCRDYNIECKNESDQNLRNAIDEYHRINKDFNFLEAWRRYGFDYCRHIKTKAVRYQHFKFPQNFRKQYGTWETKTIDSDYCDINWNLIHLRLQGDTIYTSRHATVKLDEAIPLFKKLAKLISNVKFDKSKEEYHIKLDGNNNKIGIYPLHRLVWTERRIEGEKPRMEWMVIIGCHNIYWTEILDFIHYYKLEKEFLGHE